MDSTSSPFADPKSVITRGRSRAKRINDHEERRRVCGSTSSTASKPGERPTPMSDFDVLNYEPVEAYDLNTLPHTHYQLMLDNLFLNRVHPESYFLCRVVTIPYLQDGVLCAMVEDIGGVAFRLVVQSFVSPTIPDCSDASWAVAPDDKILVLEPVCQFGRVVYAPTIVVVNPAHIVLLDDDDPFLKSFTFTTGPCAPEVEAERRVVGDDALSQATALSKAGTAHFRQGRFCAAAATYKNALRLCGHLDDEHNKVALLGNASQSMLKIGHYRLALRDARRALAIRPDYVKTSVRLVRARLGLHQFEEAWKDLERGLKANPDSAELKELRGRLEARMIPPRGLRGSYDFRTLLEDARNHTTRFLLCPDFIGDIRVAPSGDRGRGLFASRTIPAGTLLLAEKALAMVFDGDAAETRQAAFGDNEVVAQHTRLCALLADFELRWRAVQLATCNKRAADAFEELYAGEAFEQKRSAPGVNSLRIPLTVRYNMLGEAFAQGERSTKLKSLTLPGMETHQDSLEYSTTSYINYNGKGMGVWKVGSCFNHDCCPNCLYFMIGDFLFVSAYRDVAEGEELTIPYCSLRSTYRNRQAILETRDFVCCCSTCCKEIEVVEKMDQLIQGRDEALTNWKKFVPDPTQAVPIYEHLAASMQMLMPSPSYHVHNALRQLGEIYHNQGETAKGADALSKAVFALFHTDVPTPGNSLALPDAPGVAFHAATLCLLSFDAQKADMLYKVGKALALQRLCNDEALVRLVYGTVFMNMIEMQLASAAASAKRLGLDTQQPTSG